MSATEWTISGCDGGRQAYYEDPGHGAFDKKDPFGNNGFNKSISLARGFGSWHAGDTFCFKDLNEKQRSHFNRLMGESKGKSNNTLALTLMLAGVPDKTILKIVEEATADGTVKKWNGEQDQVRSETRNEHRGRRKGHGVAKRKYDFKESYIYRQLQNIYKGKYGLSLPIESPKTGSGYGANIAGLIKRGLDSGFTVGQDWRRDYGNGNNYWLSDRSYVPLYAMFGNYNEDRRQTILQCDATRKMLVDYNYRNKSYRVKIDGMDDKAYRKKQAQLLYEDLYACAVAEEESCDGIFTEDETDYGNNNRIRTLTEILYENDKMLTAEMLGLLETALMVSETMGFWLVHKRSYNSKDNARGGKRILQHLLKANKTYDKLLKQGFEADVARQTAMEELDAWLSDYKNTDTNWQLFKRFGWDKPETVEKKPSRNPSGKKKEIATAEDVEEILAKIEKGEL